MVIPNFGKLAALTLMIIIIAAGCRFWQKPAENAATPTPPTNEQSDIPFSTLEPDTYEAEVWVTFYNDGKKSERKTFTAKSGIKRLSVFNSGEKNEISFLQTESVNCLIYKEKKAYAELQAGSSQPTAASGETLESYLRTEWLSEKTAAVFEDLGTENGLRKYRVKLGDVATETNEVLVFVDEANQMPVRQEFYSAAGDGKNLIYSYELRNLKLTVDESHFTLPGDYRKVSLKEFHELQWQEKE